MSETVMVYSLYGSHPKYHVGLMQNLLHLSRLPRPPLVQLFYNQHDPGCETTARAARVLYYLTSAHGIGGDFLPFVACRLHALSPRFYTPGNVVLMRDTDSRPTHREELAVQEFHLSTHEWHCMLDHPHHTMPMMGGMIGYRSHRPLPIKRLWDEWATDKIPVHNREEYSTDQRFMRDKLWPAASVDSIIHDTFRSSPEIRSCTRCARTASNPRRGPRLFPPSRTDTTDAFVGEVFDENNIPRAADRAVYVEARARLGYSVQSANS